MARYLLYRLSAALAPLLPERGAYRLFTRVGDLMYLVAPGARRLVRNNLAGIAEPDLPEAEMRRRVRGAFRNLAWSYLELFRVPVFDLDEMRARGTIEGTEHFERAREGPTGTLLVFSHCGNLEASAQVPLLYPQDRFVLVLGLMENERVHELMRRLRSARGLDTVRTDENLRMLRLLRDGCHVLLAGDLDSTGGGVVVDYFGRPARMPQGAVRLALRTGAPLLPVAGWRTSAEEPWRYRVRVHPPLALEGSADSKDDIRAGVQRLARVMEKVVAEEPAQWLAFRQIWLEEAC